MSCDYTQTEINQWGQDINCDGTPSCQGSILSCDCQHSIDCESFDPNDASCRCEPEESSGSSIPTCNDISDNQKQTWAVDCDGTPTCQNGYLRCRCDHGSDCLTIVNSASDFPCECAKSIFSGENCNTIYEQEYFSQTFTVCLVFILLMCFTLLMIGINYKNPKAIQWRINQLIDINIDKII